MALSKKHYIALADIVCNARQYALHEGHATVPATLDRVQSELAAYLGGDNPRFDYERFAEACQPPAEAAPRRTRRIKQCS